MNSVLTTSFNIISSFQPARNFQFEAANIKIGFPKFSITAFTSATIYFVTVAIFPSRGVLILNMLFQSTTFSSSLDFSLFEYNCEAYIMRLIMFDIRNLSWFTYADSSPRVNSDIIPFRLICYSVLFQKCHQIFLFSHLGKLPTSLMLLQQQNS